MTRKNAYALGVTELDKDGTKISGFLFLNKNGQVKIGKRAEDAVREFGYFNNSPGFLVVAENLEDAQHMTRWMSRVYRSAFRKYAKKHNFSMNDFQFYLVKLSNPTFDDYEIVTENRFFHSYMINNFYKHAEEKSRFLGNKQNIQFCTLRHK